MARLDPHLHKWVSKAPFVSIIVVVVAEQAGSICAVVQRAAHPTSAVHRQSVALTDADEDESKTHIRPSSSAPSTTHCICSCGGCEGRGGRHWAGGGRMSAV